MRVRQPCESTACCCQADGGQELTGGVRKEVTLRFRNLLNDDSYACRRAASTMRVPPNTRLHGCCTSKCPGNHLRLVIASSPFAELTARIVPQLFLRRANQTCKAINSNKYASSSSPISVSVSIVKHQIECCLWAFSNTLCSLKRETRKDANTRRPASLFPCRTC
jgi:hypothetical protein